MSVRYPSQKIWSSTRYVAEDLTAAAAGSTLPPSDRTLVRLALSGTGSVNLAAGNEDGLFRIFIAETTTGSAGLVSSGTVQLSAPWTPTVAGEAIALMWSATISRWVDLWRSTATGGGGTGTVTTVSVATANGLAGTVANPTTTPAITLSTTANGLLQGNGTAISAAIIGTGLSFAAGTLSNTQTGLTDGDKGDITVASSGTSWTVDTNAITNTKLADMATATFKGRASAGSGDPEDITGTQATTLLDTFTSSLKGLAPASGGGAANYLRADSTWANPLFVAEGSAPSPSTGIGKLWANSAADARPYWVDGTGQSFNLTLDRFNTLTPAASVAIDTSPALPVFNSLSLNGNTTFTTTNLGNGRSASVRVIADGTTRTLTFPAGWTWLGSGPPAVLAAGDVGYLSITAYGTANTDVVAAWSYENMASGVTTVSVVTANGLAGTVANPTTTPAITLSTTANGLLQGNGTAISAATIGSGLSFAAGTLSNTQIGLTDGDKIGITVSGGGSTWLANSNTITNNELSDMINNRIKGRVGSIPGDPQDLTGTEVTTLLDVFTTSLKGLAPASGGGTSNFLRADGTWAVPPDTVENDIPYSVGTTIAVTGGSVITYDGYVVRPIDLSGSGTFTVSTAGVPDGALMLLTVASISGTVMIETDSNVHLHGREWMPESAGEILTLQYVASLGYWAESSRSITYDSSAGFLAKNSSGSTITRGKLVYINGAVGNNPLIVLADFSSEATSAGTVGMVYDDIPNNQFGHVITVGIVRNVNTNGITAGAPVYLGAAGAFTAVKPSAPNHIVKVGNVVRVSSTVGTIQVQISNGWELDELHDVDIDSPAKGNLLVRNNVNLWQNFAVGADGYVLTAAAAAPTGLIWQQPTVGTVTGVSVVTANGLAGTVANPTTTPAITLSTSVTGVLKGNGTAISAATAGTDYAPATSGTSILSGNGAGGFSSVTIGTGLSFATGTLSNTQVGVTDGDKGDITVASSGTSWTVDTNAITNAKLADMATATFKARVTAGSGDPEDITGTQATTLLDVFTTSLKGLAPASGGGTSNFLRADGTWAAPAGSGSVTTVSVVTANGLAGTVANPTTTPAITLSTSVTGVLKGNGTAISAAVADVDYLAPGPAYVTSSSALTPDNSLARFDGPSGKIIQDSGIVLSDAGEFSRAGDISIVTSGAGTDISLNAVDTVQLTGAVLKSNTANAQIDTTSAISLAAGTTIRIDSGSVLTLDATTNIVLQNAGTTEFIIDGTALQGVEIGLPGTQRAPYIRSAETALNQLQSPLYSFVGDQNTGMTSSNDDTITLVTGGTSRLTIDTTAITAALPHRGTDGIISAPAYSFSGGTGTGMWRTGKALNFSIDTENILSLSQNAAGNSIQSVADGTVARPAYSWVGSTNTGFYYDATDSYIGVTLNGVRACLIDASGITGVQTRGAAISWAPGTVSSLPAYGFFGDPNTGMYSPAADNIEFSAGGAVTLELDTVAVTIDSALVYRPVVIPSLTADNQLITVDGTSYIRFSSNTGVATNRTFTLSNGSRDGQVLILQCTANAAELLDTGNVSIAGTMTFGADDTISLIWDGSNWVETSRSNN